jgi:hypothetical protein
VCHRLHTSKRRSAGSSPRAATMPHLSPSSPCRPHRWPSSVDHLPHRRPLEGHQSCCNLTVLPSRCPRSTSPTADARIRSDTAAPAPGANSSLASTWAAPVPISWWAMRRHRSYGPHQALCKRAVMPLCSWAAEGFDPLASDLLCYFMYIFKSLQIQKFVQDSFELKKL